MSKLHLEDDHQCYVCGKENPHGLHLEFSLSADGALHSSVIFSKEHQGFKGIVHGGMMAAVLDDIMVNLLWHSRLPAVTAELKLRLKRPAKVGEKILLSGWVEKKEEKIIYTKATAKNEAGEILATASAACFRVKTS